MDPNTEIERELLPYVRVYKGGRVERLLNTPLVPAGVDATTGVASKDITVSPSSGVSARLYLPDLSSTTTPSKLPILVYYHGGAFIFESAFSSLYHNHLNLLAAAAGILIVSVEYRLAPEHPLPAAYEDAWEALRWAAGGSHPWLAQHGDFSRVFVAGDSAGGNITHHVAARAGTAPPEERVELEGVMLIHPYFWGSGEVAAGTVDTETGEWMQALWRFVCPGTEGDDDPWINPAAAAPPPGLAALGGRRAVVFVAGKDFLRRKGVAYYEALKASGWGGKAGLVETEGEEHVFHLTNPTCENAVDMVKRMVDFFKE